MTIELTARYHLPDDESALLLLEGDLYVDLDADQEKPPNGNGNGNGILLTILHEQFAGGAVTHDLEGVFKHQFYLINGETLTLIARREGRVVASLVNEVDTTNAGRVLLRPKGGFHLIIHQRRCEQPEDVAQLQAPVKLSPTTGTLAHLLQAVEEHYANAQQWFPVPLSLLWSALTLAIGLNDEQHSQQMLSYLCSVLEELELHRVETIRPRYDAATSASKT